MEETDFFLCANCAKDSSLNKYVLDNAKQQDQFCTICLANNNVIDISLNSKLNQFCRFLIRYHLPEYIYNHKWGGESFPAPFLEENPIINHNFKNYGSRKEEVQLFIDDLFDLGVFPYHDLYYGSDENGKSLFGDSIKDAGSFYWKKYKRDLEVTNHYLLKADALNTFKSFFEKHEYILKLNTLFYRARIGFDESEDEIDGLASTTKIPFKSEKISAPPILKAKAGRLNRPGVSYLYLGSSENVSIGEVRPSPGQYVSIGKFRNNTDLKIADLRFLNLFDYFDDKEKLKIFLFLRDISNELSIPVVPEEQERYLVTQFISDTIRDLGFDGIMYNSSVTTGYNILVFDSSKFEYLNEDSVLLKVEKMSYQLGKVEFVPDRFTGWPIEETTDYTLFSLD